MAYSFPTADSLENAKSIEQRFRLMNTARSTRMEQLREMASYVSPRLLPEYEYHTEDQLLTERYSSTPLVLALKLTAKIVASVYPLNNVPFFNWLIRDVPQFNDEQMDQAWKIAYRTEFIVANRLDASNFRQALHNAVLNAQVLGDTVIYQSDDYDFRVYPINEFVLRRDAAGNIAEMVLRDWLEPDLLDDNLRSLNNGKPKSEFYPSSTRLEPHYTRLMWNTKTKKWDVEKEFRCEVYERDVSYTNSPYYHIGWEQVNTEDYSRSLVEAAYGEIRSLEMLTKALVQTAAAISRVHPAVSPTGMTRAEDLDHPDIENMDVVTARAEDVFWLTPPLNPQLQALVASVQMAEEKLSKVFLSDTAGTLTGERVTAYQIQEVVQEMEQTLGNVLGSIAQQIQRPVILRTLELERRNGTISQEEFDLLSQIAELEIKSGLDALGRQLEGARLQALLSVLPSLPPGSIQKMDFDAVLEKLMVSSGLDPSGLMKSDEQLAAEQEAAQQQAIQQQIAQQAIQTGGAVVEQQARNQA